MNYYYYYYCYDCYGNYDFEEYVYHVQDKNLDLFTKFKKRFEEFSLWIEDKTEANFKKIPMASKWTKTAKVLLVSSFVIPPVVFISFYMFLLATVWWHNRGVD